MIWQPSNRADPEVVPIADRHYNRQKIGAPQFCPPGPAIVFKAKVGGVVKAYWACGNPAAKYVKHAWRGAWINTAFRNEGAGLSSYLIREAIAFTRGAASDLASWNFGDVPALGLVTFVDREKIRHKRDPGRCYRKAGFDRAKCPNHSEHVDGCAACDGLTEGGLVALQLFADSMPEPVGVPLRLFVVGGAP